MSIIDQISAHAQCAAEGHASPKPTGVVQHYPDTNEWLHIWRCGRCTDIIYTTRRQLWQKMPMGG